MVFYIGQLMSECSAVGLYQFHLGRDKIGVGGTIWWFRHMPADDIWMAIRIPASSKLWALEVEGGGEQLFIYVHYT